MQLSPGNGGRDTPPAAARKGVRPVHPWLVGAFRRIAERRLRSGFRALRLRNADALRRAGIDPETAPLAVYLNHPSWWDPLTGFALAHHLFGARRFYAPMDAEALQRYRILQYVGMFPVEADSPRGAAQFLRTGNAVLRDGHLLAVTPQGRFADARERPVVLRPGLAALLSRRAAQGDATAVLPIALEYTFWDQRLPEALAACGEPFWVGPGQAQPAIQAALQDALQHAMDTLQASALERSPEAFTTVLEGKSGSAGFYSLLERLQARVRPGTSAGDHQVRR